MRRKKVALFGSGVGSNARNLIEKLSDKFDFAIFTNNQKSGFPKIAEDFSLKMLSINEESLVKTTLEDVDLIVLVGFLIKIPQEFIQNNAPIINIHPSLLPKYGGKGMWGDNVHRKVLENGENESGITIHYVNEEYDSGNIIFQTKCGISENETVDSLRSKIKILELKHLPSVIVDLVNQMETVKSDS